MNGISASMIAVLLLIIIIMIMHVDAQSTTAIAVIGQADFYSRLEDPFSSGPDPFDFNVGGISADNDGGLYVADTENNRVLYFPPGANNNMNNNINNSAAIRVYGQPDFYSGRRNRGNGNSPSANSLSTPSGVAVASDGVYIADSVNHRVLFFSGTSTTASRVYGQGGSFTTNNLLSPSADSLYGPPNVYVDKDNNVYIADANNHRVLFFPPGSTTATRVYGQGGSFTTKNAPSPPTADSLNLPYDVAVSNNGVYIADYGNNRVLFYPGTSTTASIVLGQAGSFVTNIQYFPPTSKSMRIPGSVTLDNQCNLYVSSYTDNRVLFFSAGSTTASRVYGQGGNFSIAEQNNGGISPSSLYNPADVAIGGNALFIADLLNRRVLKYTLNDGSASSNGPCSRNTVPAETTPPPSTTSTTTTTTTAPPATTTSSPSSSTSSPTLPPSSSSLSSYSPSSSLLIAVAMLSIPLLSIVHSF